MIEEEKVEGEKQRGIREEPLSKISQESKEPLQERKDSENTMHAVK